MSNRKLIETNNIVTIFLLIYNIINRKQEKYNNNLKLIRLLIIVLTEKQLEWLIQKRTKKKINFNELNTSYQLVITYFMKTKI